MAIKYLNGVSVSLIYKDSTENELSIKVSMFPSGEVSLRLTDVEIMDTPIRLFKITINNSNLAGNLMLINGIVDALKNKYKAASSEMKVALELPYFPYSRQDRYCQEGESFSLKVFVDNLSPYIRIIRTDDIHSDVLEKLLDERYITFYNHSQLRGLIETLDSSSVDFHSAYTCIISPDKGATLKSKEIADYFHVPLLQMYKTRTENGIVSEVGHASGRIDTSSCLIVDDICDGGATFIQAAKALNAKGIMNIDLFVTHGFFSNGFEELNKYFKNIYCKNNYRTN